MNFFNELDKTIEKWSMDPIEDEWLFEDFRQTFIRNLSSAEAFSYIGQTISILVQQSDESTATEVLHTVLNLANQSDTTELVPELIANKSILVEQFEAYGDYERSKLDELFLFYRI